MDCRTHFPVGNRLKHFECSLTRAKTTQSNYNDVSVLTIRDTCAQWLNSDAIYAVAVERNLNHGSLVVKVSDCGWLVTSSSPIPLKTRRVGSNAP
ncbi:hypothetical protein TNCV_4996361 [Trichonephila clavipes]|nr:hypothetical protein TNCV_4996361 [Trichonephila clavipes]